MYQIFNSIESEPIFMKIQGRKFINRFMLFGSLLILVTLFFSAIISSWCMLLNILLLVLLQYYRIQSAKNKYNIEKLGISRPKAIKIKTSQVYKSIR